MTSEMTENLIAKVDFEDAKMLSDLASIAQDLGAVMKICSRLKALLREESLDHLLVESLWTTALIKYARCYGDSKRFGLSESIFHGLQGDPVGTHQFYLDLRNKHVAHSVNPFEQMEVGAILAPAEADKRKVMGVASLAMRHICSDLEGVHALGCLSKVVLKKVCVSAKAYESKVLDQIEQMPIEDLYEQAALRLIAPGPELADSSRQQ